MINDVEIIDPNTVEIFPGMGMFAFTCKVRANITVPGCFLNIPIAKVLKGGTTQVGTDLSLSREGTTDWYSADFSTTSSLQPGDGIEAEVTATWMCPGSDSENSGSVTVPPATVTATATSKKPAAKSKSAKKTSAKKKASKS